MRVSSLVILLAACSDTTTTNSDTDTDTYADTDTDTDSDTDTDTDTDTDSDTDTDTDADADADTVIVDFEEVVPPVMTGFGNEDSSVVVDPTDATNQVGQLVKPDNAELWAGTTISYCANNGIAPLPFTATETSMSARVWSPDAGVPVRLKVESAIDPTVSVETESSTSVAGDWETLTFDFANEVAGTAALNLASTYDKMSFFPNFGTTGADAGAKIYYVDDVTFLGAVFSTDCVIVVPAGALPITFDDAGTTYTLTGFGGAEDAAVEADPVDAGNSVARVNKSATAETWGGTTFSTLAGDQIEVLPLTATDLQMVMRIRSPRAGIPVRLKVEDAGDPTHSVETEALTTAIDTWETLTFDFGIPAAGTAAWNAGYTYNRSSVFFDFGKAGVDGGNGTFYFDDVDMAP